MPKLQVRMERGSLPGEEEGMTKPEFRLPSMEEVRAVTGTNGLTVVSTFTGCGGSCTGFKMAGYKVVWASEFVEAARETYSANYPDVPLDPRDIREVKPEEILKATGLREGQLDVLQGSPPCASFSMSGKRAQHWGKEKAYSDTKQRTDDLFFEFSRILKGLMPRTFVAENVAGLTRGAAIGYFRRIMAELDSAGYSVECRILDAQWLGVPQTRNRAIFVGVRKDLGKPPVFPQPLPYNYTIRDALPWIKRVVHDTSGERGQGTVTDKLCPAITVGVNSVNSYHFKVEDDASFEGYAIEGEWKRLRPGEGSDKYLNLVRCHPDRPSNTITATGGQRGAAGPTHPHEPRKFSIEELRRICSFPTDFELRGTYAQQWERLGRAVPPVMMFQIARALRDGVFAPLGLVSPGLKEAFWND